MATAIANIEDKPGKALTKAPVSAGNALRAFIPNTLEEAWRLAGALANSGMTPKAYGSDQNKVMVGMLAGAEVGLTPFAALQSIAVINGNPSMWGDGMLGLVEASGLLEDLEETDDGKEAKCVAKRKGRPTPVVNTFSMDDAKTAGLLGKQGPWQQYPKRMRKLRARSFTLRDLFPDVLKGIKAAEEVGDYLPIDGGTISQGAAISAAMLSDHSESVDEATGEIVREGRADEQHGDQHDGTTDIAQKLIARLKLAKSLAGVDALELEYTEAAKPMLDPSDQELVEIEIEAARAQLAK